jgi:glycerol kinase
LTAYLGAIDQGTSSTRFIVFDESAGVVAQAQTEHGQIYPRPGWVEHDPQEIWSNTQAVIADALRAGSLRAQDVAAIGITNQRETTVVWNRHTGAPLTNALVWQDTRATEYLSTSAESPGSEFLRARTGLPLSSYFSGLKIRWVLDHVPGARERAEAGDVLFGNIDANLEMIRSSSEIEALARTVADNGGIYLVPAFSGLYAPHWNDRARGIIVGLTRHTTRGHLARAVIEATAFQTWKVLRAMERDSGVALESLRVDGGMTENHLLMQFQADIVDRTVVRPAVKETTALGAAFAAGLAVGVFRDVDDLRSRWRESHRWTPQMADETRQGLLRRWNKAVTRSIDWEE